ncbi:MAG: hypothetical protein V3W20_00605 [Candidatus Neomarinimicrobiota bacterium]
MDIQEIMKQRFTSGNSIPVERTRITKTEYDQLINSVKEEHLAELSDSQKEIYNAFVQYFDGGSYNIDGFLLWIVRNRNVEQSIYLNKYNQKP